VKSDLQKFKKRIEGGATDAGNSSVRDDDPDLSV
jgi:hypothetical protein